MYRDEGSRGPSVRATRLCSYNVRIFAVTVKVNVPRLPHFLACLTSSALRRPPCPMVRARATTPGPPTVTANHRRFSRKPSANHARCNCNPSEIAPCPATAKKIGPALEERKSRDSSRRNNPPSPVPRSSRSDKSIRKCNCDKPLIQIDNFISFILD